MFRMGLFCVLLTLHKLQYRFVYNSHPISHLCNKLKFMENWINIQNSNIVHFSIFNTARLPFPNRGAKDRELSAEALLPFLTKKITIGFLCF